MNTDTYKASANAMPLECAGMFFIPEHSSNFGFSGMSASTPLDLVPRGFDCTVKNSTFQNIPLEVECQKKNITQQPRGLQRCQVFNILDIPHVQPYPPPHCSGEHTHGRPFSLRS
jgi:hypothetical protein